MSHNCFQEVSEINSNDVEEIFLFCVLNLEFSIGAKPKWKHARKLTLQQVPFICSMEKKAPWRQGSFSLKKEKIEPVVHARPLRVATRVEAGQCENTADGGHEWTPRTRPAHGSRQHLWPRFTVAQSRAKYSATLHHHSPLRPRSGVYMCTRDAPAWRTSRHRPC
jgi:hypothetical protein